MKKFEYKILSYIDEDIDPQENSVWEAYLNELGEQGWELICCMAVDCPREHPYSSHGQNSFKEKIFVSRYYLKRQKS